MTKVNMADYVAMTPYFDVVTHALEGLVDGDNFFDLHAEDAVIEYVITVPGYPRQVVGRDNLAELYRGYGDVIVQDSSSELCAYYDRDKSVVVLEYTIHGTVVRSGAPYVNRFVSVITIENRKIAYWRDYLDPLAVIAAFGDDAPGASGG
jgi:uncharacterized protein